jgi:glycosyltransferase involved in cell wall biosynthesis
MRIAITTTRAPFVHGGAEVLERDLIGALRQHGHTVEVVAYPFRYGDASVVERSVDIWASEDLMTLSGPSPDRVIALKFPAYFAKHPHVSLWLLHQHRAYYELWSQAAASSADCDLRERVLKLDAETFSRAERRFAISRNVARRAEGSSGSTFMPLYPPPPGPDRFFCAEPRNYIFAPSRLESLKRQGLLIEAMQYVKSDMVVLIAGEGGQRPYYEQLITRLGLSARVRLLGAIDDAALCAAYAHASAVYFGPKDEDYGYVTLEAMLSAKPVITCHDSGGPLEFVEHGATGWIEEPTPQAIAATIDEIAANTSAARRLGQQGREALSRYDFSWERVVTALVGV